jgi:hypothetical protein
LPAPINFDSIDPLHRADRIRVCFKTAAASVWNSHVQVAQLMHLGFAHQLHLPNATGLALILKSGRGKMANAIIIQPAQGSQAVTMV